MRQSMKDFFKRVKADAIMSAVLCIALGVVLIVWPGETINIVCKVLAAGLIILGGVELFSYITNRNGYMFTGILGLIVLIVGLAVVPSLVVGLIVAMFQAATQINEQTLSFLPRLIVMLVTLIWAGPWLVSQLMEYTQTLIQNIPYLIG